MRNPLIIGNWKLHGSRKMVNELISNLSKELANVTNCSIAIAPPVMYLEQARCAAQDSPIMLGAQNVDINLSGAFTGEISAVMLKDVGVKYTIVGHSERRMYHKESDELIAKKFFILKQQNLIPVLCIGEKEPEKEAKRIKEVCVHQIDAILHTTQEITSFSHAVIAYEPIWAIGTGKTPSPTQVQAVHEMIRNHIAKADPKTAEQLIILYGGSVNPSNASELFSQPDIDGALVGGASIKGDAFSLIVKAAEAAKKRNYIFS